MENSAEKTSFHSDNRASMTYPLYPCLLFMTATSSASIIALRGWRDFRRDGTAQCAQFTVAPPQHFLYFFPEPHGHGAFRPTLEAVCQGVAALLLRTMASPSYAAAV